MQKAIKPNQFTKGVTKTVITAAGMTGTVIGAYHAKNFVIEVSDNEILGIAAGVTTLILGAAVVNRINKSVDKSIKAKSQPLLIEASDGYKIEIVEEGVGSDE